MSNLPLGAEYDSTAPYNEQESVFEFDVQLKGKLFVVHPSFGTPDEYNIRKEFLNRINKVTSELETAGDIEITNAFVELY